jgi:oligopeptide/dipeptide ABC transporter ATP-binding protein
VEVPLLNVRDLETIFKTEEGTVRAVDKVSLSIDEGETVGIVGESGCGKSATALSIMGLIPSPPGKVIGGEILFKGRDLMAMSEANMRRIRGNEISMIFQEPMTSLNPVYTVGDQIMETVALHQKLSKADASDKTIEMLRLVGIPSPENRVDDYPHQMSGGMRQRVMIAMALACKPSLLIADEPTTALDVTIQAQILELMGRLKGELKTAILLITHDLGVVAATAARVIVMYAGRIVEIGAVASLFADPLHPYTEGLMLSIPHVSENRRRLHVIRGMVPNPLNMPEGCAFHPRCELAKDICRHKQPELVKLSNGRQVRCWRY